MPLVRTDMLQGLGLQDLRQLENKLHGCALEAFSLPERECFQFITEHEPYQMILQTWASTYAAAKIAWRSAGSSSARNSCGAFGARRS